MYISIFHIRNLISAYNYVTKYSCIIQNSLLFLNNLTQIELKNLRKTEVKIWCLEEEMVFVIINIIFVNVIVDAFILNVFLNRIKYILYF